MTQGMETYVFLMKERRNMLVALNAQMGIPWVEIVTMEFGII